MPAVFEQLGIRFEYPENWEIEEMSEGEVEQVVVSSPNTAFWHLSKYPAETDLEPLFDEAMAALRSEHKGMETEPVNDEVDGRALTGFDVNFICLDLTNTCWLRGFQTEEATFLLICQAEDGEFAGVGPVFQAMLASVLPHPPRPPRAAAARLPRAPPRRGAAGPPPPPPRESFFAWVLVVFLTFSSGRKRGLARELRKGFLSRLARGSTGTMPVTGESVDDPVVPSELVESVDV